MLFNKYLRNTKLFIHIKNEHHDRRIRKTNPLTCGSGQKKESQGK
jgi:hypothetical protein